MLKRWLQTMANACGYRIQRLKTPTAEQDAIVAMTQLLDGVENPNIFDVGAHHGHFSLTLRKAIPKSLVYAFEPFDESFVELKRNTASDPRVFCYEFGLADSRGIRNLHSNSSPATNSLFPSHHRGAQIWGTGLLETQNLVQARFDTLDAFVEKVGVAEINLLKLDVQGAEHLVMAGAASACSLGLIKVIYAEVIAQPTYHGQKRFDESLALYYESGFDLFGIYNPCSSKQGRLCQVDVLFTRRLS